MGNGARLRVFLPPARRKEHEINRFAILVQIAAEVSGIPADDLIDRVNARLAVLLADE